MPLLLAFLAGALGGALSTFALRAWGNRPAAQSKRLDAYLATIRGLFLEALEADAAPEGAPRSETSPPGREAP